ncbi:MAG: PRC-barrel domain-containing protein [Legionellaceae bacterium]|nr:PRC-barrel domain-containing protein [Legionellaceae bacterium]MBP9775555.1 PRC-barrel domain-containing protein [Legionellaceae bacterium]
MDHIHIVKASEITGTKVKNMAGENLGEINDVVIDKSQGKISYLVLDFGGLFGFGNKFFAMPWNLFTYDQKDGNYIIKLDKERLKNSPGFDKDNWPNFSEQAFVTSINKYYL